MLTRYRAGTTIPLTLQSASYLPTDGWEAWARLRGANNIDVGLVSTADGMGWAMSAQAAQTQAWTPGVYDVHYTVEKSGVVHVVAQDRLEILPALSGLSHYDARSYAQQMVDRLRRLLLGRAERSDFEYVVGDRRLRSFSHKELREELLFWERRLDAENGKTDAPGGRKTIKYVLG